MFTGEINLGTPVSSKLETKRYSNKAEFQSKLQNNGKGILYGGQRINDKSVFAVKPEQSLKRFIESVNTFSSGTSSNSNINSELVNAALRNVLPKPPQLKGLGEEVYSVDISKSPSVLAKLLSAKFPSFPCQDGVSDITTVSPRIELPPIKFDTGNQFTAAVALRIPDVLLPSMDLHGPDGRLAVEVKYTIHVTAAWQVLGEDKTIHLTKSNDREGKLKCIGGHELELSFTTTLISNPERFDAPLSQRSIESIDSGYHVIYERVTRQPCVRHWFVDMPNVLPVSNYQVRRSAQWSLVDEVTVFDNNLLLPWSKVNKVGLIELSIPPAFWRLGDVEVDLDYVRQWVTHSVQSELSSKKKKPWGHLTNIGQLGLPAQLGDDLQLQDASWSDPAHDLVESLFTARELEAMRTAVRHLATDVERLTWSWDDDEVAPPFVGAADTCGSKPIYGIGHEEEIFQYVFQRRCINAWQESTTTIGNLLVRGPTVKLKGFYAAPDTRGSLLSWFLLQESILEPSIGARHTQRLLIDGDDEPWHKWIGERLDAVATLVSEKRTERNVSQVAPIIVRPGDEIQIAFDSTGHLGTAVELGASLKRVVMIASSTVAPSTWFENISGVRKNEEVCCNVEEVVRWKPKLTDYTRVKRIVVFIPENIKPLTSYTEVWNVDYQLEVQVAGKSCRPSGLPPPRAQIAPLRAQVNLDKGADGPFFRRVPFQCEGTAAADHNGQYLTVWRCDLPLKIIPKYK